MLPIRNKTIFKSRWWALAWSGGILWSAIDFAGAHSAPKPDATANAAISNGSAPAPAPVATDPATSDEIAGAKAAVQAFDAIK